MGMLSDSCLFCCGDAGFVLRELYTIEVLDLNLSSGQKLSWATREVDDFGCPQLSTMI